MNLEVHCRITTILRWMNKRMCINNSVITSHDVNKTDQRLKSKHSLSCRPLQVICIKVPHVLVVKLCCTHTHNHRVCPTVCLNHAPNILQLDFRVWLSDIRISNFSYVNFICHNCQNILKIRNSFNIFELHSH